MRIAAFVIPEFSLKGSRNSTQFTQIFRLPARNPTQSGVQSSEPGKNKPTALREASHADAQQTPPSERSPIPDRSRSSRILIETKRSQHHAQPSQVRQGWSPDRDARPVFDIFLARKARQTGFFGKRTDFRGKASAGRRVVPGFPGEEGRTWGRPSTPEDS